MMMGGGAEPTMTINTKEALADVFGMYNSPEKTMKLAGAIGSKHAPLHKVKVNPVKLAPITLAPVTPAPPQNQNENAGVYNAKTPGSSTSISSLRIVFHSDLLMRSVPTIRRYGT